MTRWLLLFILILFGSVWAQETVIVKVRDMSRGMELLPTPYRNDPEAISLSENFYSLQPGVAVTRFGTTELINYDSFFVDGTDTTFPVAADAESVVDFALKSDSSAIVFAAGGNWYWSFYGKRINGKMNFQSAPLAVARRIDRYSPGTASYSEGTIDISFGLTKNTRHLQPGDTLVVETNNDTFVVKYVISDVAIVADSVNDLTTTTNSAWHAWGSYGGSEPFLYSSGEYLYTGDNQSPPQVIYNWQDTLFMRPLRQVDSFRVDGIINFYIDTTDDGDTLRKSYEIVSNDTIIKEIQLVSRRAGWRTDEWLFDITLFGDAPTAYFVRLGWHQAADVANIAKYFPISGNSDTAMYLSAWYVSDTLGNSVDSVWRDSLLSGHGLRMQDTMDNSDITNSPWAYIYTAVGTFDVVVQDKNTDTIELFGRGAVMRITDTSTFFVDPDTFWTGMYYIHLTADDITFPAYGVGPTVSTRIVTRKPDLGEPLLIQNELPVGDTIIASSVECNAFRHFRRIPEACNYYYTVRSTKFKETIDAEFVNKSFFPVRYAEMALIADTNDDGSFPLYIVTATASFAMLADVSSAKTVNWELVRIGMPEWSGMTSWGNPDQLVAWGDTALPSLVSAATAGQPWDWTVTNDLVVGDPSDPTIAVLGYDELLMAFQDATIQGFNGETWVEISLSDGLVGSRAIAKRNKEVFWLDRGDLKVIARRDFQGHSIRSLSDALVPAFRGWTAANYNVDVVPFTVNPKTKHLSVLTYNQFDEHLYLFFPEGGSLVNNKCLTFDLKRNQWDGLFDLAVADAFFMEFDDTMKVICVASDSGSLTDTVLVFAIDNVYEDFATDAAQDIAIDAQRKSHKFWVENQRGEIMESTLKLVRILHRGNSNALAANSRLVMRSNQNMSGLEFAARSDSVDLSVPSTQGDQVQFWRPSGGQTGTYWQWDLIIKGVTTTPAPYSIYGMDFEFITVGRDD